MAKHSNMTIFDKMLEDFEEAVRQHEVRGTYTPDEARIIELEYQLFKNDLKQFVEDNLNERVKD